MVLLERRPGSCASDHGRQPQSSLQLSPARMVLLMRVVPLHARHLETALGRGIDALCLESEAQHRFFYPCLPQRWSAEGASGLGQHPSATSCLET
jgi:hypothetical protein